MRDIKFRAWTFDEMYYNIGINPHSEDYYVFDADGALFGLYGSKPAIMQFTGLKDNKDKDIYEGDILNHGFSEDDPCYCEVIFENGAFRKRYMNWDNTLPKPAIDQEEINLLHLVVAGNIHETPELLQAN